VIVESSIRGLRATILNRTRRHLDSLQRAVSASLATIARSGFGGKLSPPPPPLAALIVLRNFKNGRNAKSHNKMSSERGIMQRGKVEPNRCKV
jgi:hypothetical protein